MAKISAKHLHKAYGEINKYNKVKQSLILKIIKAKLIYKNVDKRKFEKLAVQNPN